MRLKIPPGQGLANQFCWKFIARIADSRVGKLQPQHSHEQLEQSRGNLWRLLSTPDSRERLNADEIVHAALKALEVVRYCFSLHTHVIDNVRHLLTRPRKFRRKSYGIAVCASER